MNKAPYVATMAAFAIVSLSVSAASAAPILDGSGFGAPSATVTYDSGAPMGNFGSPGSTTNGAAYDIYTRADATYAYVLVKQNGTGGTPPTPIFANLYFGTGASAASTSDLGFETTNSDVFFPGVSAPISTSGQGIEYASLSGGTAIEFAVPFTYFETDPQHIGFDTTSAANPDIILRLSQSFGYSVAGGSSYGADRLGLIVDPIKAPEPTPLAVLGAGLGMLGLARKRRRSYSRG